MSTMLEGGRTDADYIDEEFGINNGTKTLFSRFCDQTVKWRGSRGLRSSTILATTQEKVNVG